MTTFEAKERETAPSTTTKPDAGPPVCAIAYLPFRHDGIALLDLFYRHKSHTLHDVIRPGFFNPVREMLAQQARVGAECFITCVLGKREDGLTVVELHVLEAKGDPSADVLVAKGTVEHFTPIRHDGSASGDEISKSAKAA